MVNKESVLAFTLFTLSAHTEENIIIVTASEVLTEEEQLAKTVENITLEEIEKNTARTFPEALRNVPGIHVQKTTHGHGSPYLRGFTGRQNLLLMDGVRINNSTWRSGPVQYWNTLDPAFLSEINIQKGVGAVIYGADSFGGTVNALTPSSGFLEKEGFFSQGKALYRFESNSKSNIGRIETQMGEGGKWGLHLGLTMKDFGDLHDPLLGTLKNTGYPEQHLDGKLDWKIHDDLTLTLLHQQTNQDDVWRWHNTLHNPGWEKNGHTTTPGTDQYRIYDQERSLTYAKLEGTSKRNWAETWRATFSFQTTQDSEVRKKSSTALPTHTEVNVHTYGLDLQASTSFLEGTLLYGGNAYLDKVQSDAANSSLPLADDAAFFTSGLYAQYSKEFHSGLTLVSGARYSYLSTKWDHYTPQGNPSANVPGDLDWMDLSLSSRILYPLNDQWELLAGVAQGFRAPNLDDLTGSQFVQNGLNSIGSTTLEPEEHLTYELGAQYETDRLTAALTGFYSTLNDQIIRIEDADGALYALNASAGKTWGIEASTHYQWNDSWTLGGQVSWVKGEVKAPEIRELPPQTQSFSKLPPLQGSVNAQWTSPEKRFWLRGELELVAEASDLSQGERAGNDNQRIPSNGTPSYMLAHLRGGAQLTEHLNLMLALENLGNTSYRVHGSGVNGGGINTLLTLSYTW